MIQTPGYSVLWVGYRSPGNLLAMFCRRVGTPVVVSVMIARHNYTLYLEYWGLRMLQVAMHSMSWLHSSCIAHRSTLYQKHQARKVSMSHYNWHDT